MNVRKDHPRVTCEACKREGPQDNLSHSLCMSCAGKLRYIDNRAGNVVEIREDMRREGIPI